MITPPPKKLLGSILQDAALVSGIQIEIALREQMMFDQMRLGEILALHGWIKQETADFFAEKWHEILKNQQFEPIGYYLKVANLLDDTQINAILRDQKLIGAKFGATAVFKGWLKQKTIDYFLENLAIAQDFETRCFCLEGDEKETIKVDPQIIHIGEGQITLPLDFKTTWGDEDFIWLDSLKCKIAWID